MLEIKNLNVSVENIKILNNFNLQIKEGEIHAIMGPNGTGKSTLSNVIMGNSRYKIDKGEIKYNGVKINNLSVDERARMGIFLSMQNPISIEGVQNSDFIRTAINAKEEEPVNLYEFMADMMRETEELKIPEEMIYRSLNVGASGGERKKNEVLQIKMLKPSFIILDELDSGLDIDSIKICCKNIKEYLKDHKDTSLLIITHYPRILEYIKPTFVHEMIDGTIVKTGGMSLALDLEKHGYNSK